LAGTPVRAPSMVDDYIGGEEKIRHVSLSSSEEDIDTEYYVRGDDDGAQS